MAQVAENKDDINCPIDCPTVSQAQSEQALARQYKCSVRSVRRWKKANAPVDDPEAMKGWLASRQRIPSGTRDGFLLPIKPSRSVAPPRPKPARRLPAPSEPTGTEKGAAASLKRLEAAEAAAYDAMQQLLQDPEAENDEIDSARAAWLKITESLRRADLAIEQARRDSGSLVPREVMEAYGAGLVINFIGSLQASLEAAVPRLAGLPTAAEVGLVLSAVTKRATTEALKHASERPYKGQSAPPWLAKAISEALEAHF